MEYLRQQFYSDLEVSLEPNRENGVNDILIEGIIFPAKQILQTDQAAHDQSFLDWLDRRKINLLDKADEILNKYDNRDRFNRLRDSYISGNVIPFVGAGLSISSGYPGWTQFLKELRTHSRISDSVLNNMISLGEYEEIAQLLYDDMRAAPFNEALENKFGHDNNLKGPVQYLPYVFNTSVITTNFDNVLKRCYDNAHCTFSEVILGADADELLRHFGAGESILLKLHGKANTGNRRILTYSEYERYYGRPPVLKTVFEAICTKALLFLGCSLYTDRTLLAMKDLALEKGYDRSIRHYAILQLKDENERLNRRDQLAESNIYPIWYPESEDHDEVIEALLVKLKEG